jgi:nucleotide-binding universal stress UspA family protein
MQAGVTLVVVTVVDDAARISASATTTSAYDPTLMFEAFEAPGKAVLAEAVSCCAAANVMPVTELLPGASVSGILATLKKHACDLIVMGTHARTGVARMFLGSTTEAVLRSSNIPVLTIRSTDAAASHPFATALLGIDDSEASDAAVAVAAKLVQSYKARIVACHAINTIQLYEDAASYPFDLDEVLDEMRSEGAAIVARSLKCASIEAAAVTVTIVDGRPATVILEAAQQHQATVIVLGSHGRRGVRRLFLGSVAEEVVRGSDVPVLVVREAL